MKLLLYPIGMLFILVAIIMAIYALFTHPFDLMLLIPLIYSSMTIVGGCLFIKISKDLDENGY